MDNSKRILKYTLILSALLVAGCNYIDDYTLGKDNTPKPKPLPIITNPKHVGIEWSADIGSFKKGMITPDLQPAFYDNMLYVATTDGQVSAVDSRTGKVQWQKKLPTPILSGPVVSANHVIVSGDDSSLHLLDRKSGEKKKRILLSSDAIAKPFIRNDTVYVKTINGNLYSIQIDNGEKNWVYERNSPEIILKASSSPVVYQNLVLAGFSDGALVGLDQKNGHIVFQQHIAFPKGASEIEGLVDIDTNPIIDGDDLYIATYQGEVGVYSIQNFQFKWHHPASTFHDLAIEGHYLIMVDSDDIVWAFDKRNGQVLWKQKGLKARGLTAPVFWNHQIWVADRLGVMHGINPNTGEFIGQLQLPSSAIAAPLIHHNGCWITTSNGQLHRLLMRN